MPLDYYEEEQAMTILILIHQKQIQIVGFYFFKYYHLSLLAKYTGIH